MASNRRLPKRKTGNKLNGLASVISARPDHIKKFSRFAGFECSDRLLKIFRQSGSSNRVEHNFTRETSFVGLGQGMELFSRR